MMLVVKILGLQLAWLACVPVYCGVRQQLMLNQPLSKPLAWLGFVLISALSLWMLCQVYLCLTAIFIFTVVLMMGWILLALVLPHWPRASLLFSLIALMMLLVALSGGGHVV
jgi:hypothetical protein